MKLKEIFGENLRYYRKKKGLSQQEVGEITGVHRVYISEIERGRKNITIDIMEAICVTMGIKVTKMLKERTAKDDEPAEEAPAEVAETKVTVEEAPVTEDEEPAKVAEAPATDVEEPAAAVDLPVPSCKVGKPIHGRSIMRHRRKKLNDRRN